MVLCSVDRSNHLRLDVSRGAVQLLPFHSTCILWAGNFLERKENNASSCRCDSTGAPAGTSLRFCLACGRRAVRWSDSTYRTAFPLVAAFGGNRGAFTNSN